MSDHYKTDLLDLRRMDCMENTHTVMRTSKEMQIGKAGEYIVCADLILKGFVAFPSEQGLPYDVVLDTGKKIMRVQVKTTLGPRVVPQRSVKTKAYIFNIKRAGKNGLRRYTDSEIDIFAMVCLDTKQVGYIKQCEMPETINIRPDSQKGMYKDERGFANYNKLKEMEKLGVCKQEMAKAIGIDIAQVYRMLKSDYIPYKTDARYFCDFERSKEWFHSAL